MDFNGLNVFCYAPLSLWIIAIYKNLILILNLLLSSDHFPPMNSK